MAKGGRPFKGSTSFDDEDSKVEVDTAPVAKESATVETPKVVQTVAAPAASAVKTVRLLSLRPGKVIFPGGSLECRQTAEVPYEVAQQFLAAEPEHFQVL